MRKIHNIVTFSTKLQEVDIYFSFKVLTQFCFLFVKYLELNSLQGKGWEREIHRGGPWGQPQHPQCEGRCTDLKICGVVNKLIQIHASWQCVFGYQYRNFCVMCVGGNIVYFVFVTTFKCMAMPSRNILVGLSDQDVCQRVQPHEVQSVLLYIFTTHVLLIKLLLWDSWQIPPKHTDTILS